MKLRDETGAAAGMSKGKSKDTPVTADLALARLRDSTHDTQSLDMDPSAPLVVDNGTGVRIPSAMIGLASEAAMFV